MRRPPWPSTTRAVSARARRWVARVSASIATVVVLVVMRAPAAMAAGSSDGIGQTPPALAWIDLRDSRGISMWNFEMSLDRGGTTSPGKFFWSSITDSCWGLYRAVCALALWFLDWVLSFTWVTTIATPLIKVGDAMQSVVDRVGVVPTLLTITAATAALWMARGLWASGIWELGMALIIATLASGVFAQPVQLVAGPNGYVVQANQVGQQLAAELATGDSTGMTPAQLRAQQTGQLVDTFIRQPTELLNFGQVLDGGKCESAYNDVVKAGPYGLDDDIRNAVGDCDQALGDYASEPAAAMAMGSLIFMPAAFVILLMALVLAGSVIAAGCWAMFQSVKSIVTLVSGLLPGGGRGSLLLTVAELIVSLFLIVFTSVFLSVFLLVIQAMFAGEAGDALPKTFVVVDIIIVVGLIMYLRQRKQIQAASQRLAQWMAKRPGGAPATRMPNRQPGLGMGVASSAMRAVAGAAQLRSQRAAARRPMGGPTFIDARQQAAFFGATPRRPEPTVHLDAEVVPEGGGAGASRRRLTGGRLALTGGGTDPSPTGPSAPGPSGQGGRSRAFAGAMVRAGTGIALASLTGGASTVVTATTTASRAARAGRGINTVRRAALTSRLAASGATGGGSGPKPSTLAGRPVADSESPRRTSTAAPHRQKPLAASGQVIAGEVISSTRATGGASAAAGGASGAPSAGRSGKTSTAGSSKTSSALGRLAGTVQGTLARARRAPAPTSPASNLPRRGRSAPTNPSAPAPAASSRPTRSASTSTSGASSAPAAALARTASRPQLAAAIPQRPAPAPASAPAAGRPTPEAPGRADQAARVQRLQERLARGPCTGADARRNAASRRADRAGRPTGQK